MKRGIFQVTYEPVFYPWAEAILDTLTDTAIKPYKVKLSEPFYAAVVRIAGATDDYERSTVIGKSLFHALKPAAHSPGNSFIPLENEYVEEDDILEHLVEVILCRCRRTGMILSLSELASLVRFPTPAVRTPSFTRDSDKTHPAGLIARGSDLVLGTNTHSGETVSVGLSSDQRTRHAYVIGASGTGKSNLLLNSVLQDIQNGQGLGVLDPHGDFD